MPRRARQAPPCRAQPRRAGPRRAQPCPACLALPCRAEPGHAEPCHAEPCHARQATPRLTIPCPSAALRPGLLLPRSLGRLEHPRMEAGGHRPALMPDRLELREAQEHRDRQRPRALARLRSLMESHAPERCFRRRRYAREERAEISRQTSGFLIRHAVILSIADSGSAA